MDIGRQMKTIASWSWLGMTIFLILGVVININGQPLGELECPDHVWRMVRDGSLTRDKVSESYFDGTNQYNCSWPDPRGKALRSHKLDIIRNSHRFGTRNADSYQSKAPTQPANRLIISGTQERAANGPRQDRTSVRTHGATAVQERCRMSDRIPISTEMPRHAQTTVHGPVSPANPDCMFRPRPDGSCTAHRDPAAGGNSNIR